MRDEPVNDPLKQLGAELDVRPSAEFAAKVRMRTSRGAVGHGPFGWMLAAVAVLAVISTASLLTRAWRPASAGPPPSLTSVAVAVPHAAPPVVPRVSVQGVVRATPVAITRAKPAALVKPVEPEVEVMVSQAQLDGLAQLRARILDGTLTADLIPQIESDRTGALSRPGEQPGGQPRPLGEGVQFGESVRYSG